MKVLLINHFPLTGSGSGVYTRNIANSLTRKGHEVCIVFPENETVISDEKFKLHPVYFKNQEIIEGQLPFNFPCFTTHPRSNKTFYDLPEAELNMYKMAFTQAIEEEIKDFRPDIIHVGHIWVLSKLAAKYNIPLIITAHGTDLIGYNKSERYRDDAKDAALMAHTIITISHENQELVKQTFDFVAPKTLLVPNGYDPEIFYKGDYSKRDVLKHFGIQRDYDKIVSFAGKFTHFKGIDILLKAAKEYEHPDTITILAGDGELFDDMKILAAELKLQNIKFVGNQPHDILRRLYNVADVSLAPSRNEAFGLVVIEAGACGAPVIGTNEGGIVDIITKDTGLLMERENYYDLALKVQAILHKQIVYDRDYIAEYTKKNYSQDIYIENLVSIYENALASKYQKLKKSNRS